MLRNTIKARNGEFHVRKVVNIINGEEGYRVDDGEYPLFVAVKLSYSDYLYNQENNEAFEQCEVFTAATHKQFIYWRDNEIDVDYITELPNRRQGSRNEGNSCTVADI